MQCPNCKTEIPIETVDVCEHGKDGGIDVFFECLPCGKNFGGTVPAESFQEFDPEAD